MQARADVVLELGTVLVCLKTGQYFTIIKVINNVNTRNSRGPTNKKFSTYVLNTSHPRAFNRGDLLNYYRPLETKTEKILYGKSQT